MDKKTYIVPEITTIGIAGTAILAGSGDPYQVTDPGNGVQGNVGGSSGKKDPWGGAMAPERVHYDWSDDEE